MTLHSKLVKLSNLTRTLAIQPNHIIRWGTHNLVMRRSCLDLELPWFSYSSIDFLDSWLEPHMTVFEWGSGGSTLFFARRVKQVVSVEHDPVWHERLGDRLRTADIDNVTLLLRSASFDDARAFAASEFAAGLPDGTADVVVIDSYDAVTPHPFRPILLPIALQRVSSRGLVVLDDSSRYTDALSGFPPHSVKRFIGVGPGRLDTTETAIIESQGSAPFRPRGLENPIRDP